MGTGCMKVNTYFTYLLSMDACCTIIILLSQEYAVLVSLPFKGLPIRQLHAEILSLPLQGIMWRHDVFATISLKGLKWMYVAYSSSPRIIMDICHTYRSLLTQKISANIRNTKLWNLAFFDQKLWSHTWQTSNTTHSDDTGSWKRCCAWSGWEYEKMIVWFGHMNLQLIL